MGPTAGVAGHPDRGKQWRTAWPGAQTGPLAERMLGLSSAALKATTAPSSQGRAIAMTTHRGRITGLVSYRSDTGREQSIPIGPCLFESIDGRSVDIVWGARGQSSVALPIEEIQAARDQGHLLLLD